MKTDCHCYTRKNTRHAFSLLILFLLVLSGCLDHTVTFADPQAQETVSESISTTKIIKQYGITWTFSDPVKFGQFITGDYYVIGPVTVISVFPTPNNGKNGSQLNPVAGGMQTFDSRASQYNPKLNVSFPLELKAGDALLSSISLSDQEMSAGVTAIDGTEHVKHSTLRTVAILTCLSSSPPPKSFRPPYVQGEKPIYNVSQIHWNLLPNIRLSGDFLPLSYYARIFQRPWIIHIPDWACRASQPIDNMPNYYRNIASAYSGASVLLISNLKGKEKLMYGFLQEGIDHYYSVKKAPSTRATNKWPILFTGLMLDVKEIKDCFIDGKIPHQFKEDLETYYAGAGESTLVSKIIPKGQGWTNWKKSKALWRNKPGTNFEHEHLHPDEWALVDQNHSGSGSGFKQEAYRHCCTSNTWVGMALSARLMNATTLWNHPAFFDYMDRWMEEDLTNFKPLFKEQLPWSERSSNPGFVKNIWDKYRYAPLH